MEIAKEETNIKSRQQVEGKKGKRNQIELNYVVIRTL